MRFRAPLLGLIACVGCSDGEAPPGAAGTVFVADERAGTVSAFALPYTGAVTTISLDDLRDGRAVTYLPHNLQASPDGRTVWITAASWEFYTRGNTGEDDEQLIVLDAARRAVIARLPMTGLLAHVVFDPAGRFAYVTETYLGQVVEIDVAALRETRRFRLGARRGPHGARVCAGRLFVANTVGRSVSVVDLGSGAVDEFDVQGTAIQVACTPDGSSVFTALQDRPAVVRVDLATRAVTRLALPDSARGPAQVYLSPDGARLWVADQGALTATERMGREVFEVDVARWTVRRARRRGEPRRRAGVRDRRDGERRDGARRGHAAHRGHRARRPRAQRDHPRRRARGDALSHRTRCGCA